MLSLLVVLVLDGALLEELARRGPVVTVEAKAPASVPKAFLDPGLPPGIKVQGQRRQQPAPSAGKPECAIKVRPADPLIDAGMIHDVTPPVDAFMAVPGRCTAKAAE